MAAARPKAILARTCLTLLASHVASGGENVACPPGGCDCPAPHGCVYPWEDAAEFSGEQYLQVRVVDSCSDVTLGEVQQLPQHVPEGAVFFLLNGASEGLLAWMRAECFASAAAAAAAKLTPRAAHVRAVSPMGRHVESFASARAQGGFVHLLILGERFHWSPVRPGFVRRLHQEDPLEMITLSVSPPVFLIRSTNGSVLGWDNEDLIKVAEPLLRDSPEKHYKEGVERHRTSKTAMIPGSPKQTRSAQLTQSIARLESASQVEGMQVVKYTKAEHYKRHQDYFVRAEEQELFQWLEWLKARLSKNVAGDLDAINSVDPRLHPSSPSFSRALYERLSAARMLNGQDSKWVGEARSDDEYKQRLEHLLRVMPMARLAKRAFASAVRRPELVMPERPLAQNRLATLFVYLNSGFEGGATGFVDARAPELPGEQELPEIVWDQYYLPECQSGIQVRPRAGDAVLFYNLRADDAVEPLSQHVACPPHSGVKYGANVWIQTGPPSRLEL